MENIPLNGLSLELYDSDKTIKNYTDEIIITNNYPSLVINTISKNDYIKIIATNDFKFLKLKFFS